MNQPARRNCFSVSPYLYPFFSVFVFLFCYNSASLSLCLVFCFFEDENDFMRLHKNYSPTDRRTEGQTNGQTQRETGRQGDTETRRQKDKHIKITFFPPLGASNRQGETACLKTRTIFCVSTKITLKQIAFSNVVSDMLRT